MQYTITDIPDEIDQALRQRADAEQKSLDRVLLDALRAYLSHDNESAKKRDLSGIAGKCLMDEATLQALEDQRKIDPELWTDSEVVD